MKFDKKQSAFFHGKKARNRLLPAVLAVCIGVGLSILAFAAVRGWEARGARTEFDHTAKVSSFVIRGGLEKNLFLLETTRGFMSGSDRVDRNAFMNFVQPLLDRSDSVKALGWAPRVGRDALAEVEGEAGEYGLEGVRLAGGDAPGSDCFPIRFLAHHEGAGALMNLDPASAPGRLKAIERSRESGKAVVTAGDARGGEAGPGSGFLLLAPVFDTGAPPGATGGKRRILQGVVFGFFRISDIVERSLAYLKHQDIVVFIYDGSTLGKHLGKHPGKHRLLYDGSNTRGERGHAPARGAAPPDAGELRRVTRMEMAGRTWAIHCTPTPRFAAGGGKLRPIGVLAAGLMFTGLLALYLLADAKRSARIDQLLENQKALNDELISKNTERKRTQTELKKHRDHLEELVDARTKELKASEEKFRKIADFAYDWEFWISPEGSFNYVSPSCERISGYAADAFLEKPELFTDVIHPEDRVTFIQHSIKIHQPEGPESLAFRLSRYSRPDSSSASP